jgi:SynChlorMet cassette radical SAM/SPASM protein ScmF
MGETEQSQSCLYPLKTLYFYLTKGCNLRCRHCWITPKFQGDDQVYPSLEPDLFRSLIEQAKPLGLSSLKLTGGEPLIHPHITELLDHVRAEKLPLTMETNGVACTPELARSIASCEHPFVSVSLDGTDAETHEWVRGVKGCFDGALSGIRNLVDAGLKPQIIMTLMQRNKDQMDAVVRLAESIGAGSVKFNVLQPTARGKRMHIAGETIDIEELIALGSWVDAELSSSTVLPLYFHQPPAFRRLGKMFGAAGDGCHSCGILGILGVLADGSYALCGIGATVPEMIFGHASRDPLKEIWLNSPILNQIRTGLPAQLQGICADCVMKHVCMGSCIAQNYYRHQDLWAPFWYCEEAHKRGLFPETRLRTGISL